MPVPETPRDVADPRREYARQTIMVACRQFLFEAVQFTLIRKLAYIGRRFAQP